MARNGEDILMGGCRKVCALPAQVQKKKILLAGKSIESQVLLLSVVFAKQTNEQTNKCKDSLQTQHSSNCETLLPFQEGRALFHPSSDLDTVFFPH